MAEGKFRVVVVGAGVSGLFMAETLKRAGIDFTVYEKAGEVGGTWRAKTFPRLFVDFLSPQYEFPFQPTSSWSRKCAPAARILPRLKTAALPPLPHQITPATRNGSTSARTPTRPGASASRCGCPATTPASSAGCGR